MPTSQAPWRRLQLQDLRRYGHRTKHKTNLRRRLRLIRRSSTSRRGLSHNERKGRKMRRPTPYKEAFPQGTKVRIADTASLEDFKSTWKYHHKLQDEQLQYANQVATVKAVGFYH